MAQRLIPGGYYLDDDSTRQAQIPGGAFINTTSAAPAVPSISVEMSTRDGVGLVGLTALHWWVWDSLAAAPIHSGTAEATDASTAVLKIDIPNTTKTVGQFVILAVSDKALDGADLTYKAFFGPVAVA